jgi:thiamine transport system substrate-binding protein
MRRAAIAAIALGALLAAAACGGAGNGGPRPTEVVLVTHDSFAVSKTVLDRFEAESGLTVRILQAGDAGLVLNRALLTKDAPEGDALFGIDDSLLSRAIDEELFDDYSPPALVHVDPMLAPPDAAVTPIDHGEVCLNVDRSWFADRGLPPPTGLDDLLEPRYRDLLVVASPATSSPGLAFLLATVARYGEDGWQRYWRALRDNGVTVADGWEEAYTQRFSGAAGSPGTRPIVVSYATSPAAEVMFAGKPMAEAPTAAIEDGCFRQIEYAGVLRGAANPDGARALIDFMLSEAFQEDVPGSMFVYPVREGIRLPQEFVDHAIQPAQPESLTPAEIAAGRDRWVAEWTRIVLR